MKIKKTFKKILLNQIEILIQTIGASIPTIPLITIAIIDKAKYLGYGMIGIPIASLFIGYPLAKITRNYMDKKLQNINKLNLQLYKERLKKLKKSQSICYCPDTEKEIEHCEAMIFELEDEYTIG